MESRWRELIARHPMTLKRDASSDSGLATWIKVVMDVEMGIVKWTQRKATELDKVLRDLKLLPMHLVDKPFWLDNNETLRDNPRWRRISSKSYLIVSWSLLAKDLNTIYDKYCASVSVLVHTPPPPHPTISAYACMPFHLTPTFWTKIFLGTTKMVFFCCAFLRQETLFSCKLLTGSPRTMQL